MLRVRNINVFYGKVQALWEVSLAINEGEIVALVGANGAGKTTLLKTICGSLCPSSGSIEFQGNSIAGLAPCSIVEMGISYVPEGRKLFPVMSARENLEMGAYPCDAWKKRKEIFEEVYEIFPTLRERQKQLARTMSGGEQQMLAMARALMSRPKLCMLDEPSSGLAPKIMLDMFSVISSLRERGITVFLVEQNVKHSLEIADRAYILENGRVVLAGKGSELLENGHIKKAYMGL